MVIIVMVIGLLIVWGVVATVLGLQNDGFGRPELAQRNRRPESRPQTRPESRPQTRPESRPQTRPESRPETRQGSG